MTDPGITIDCTTFRIDASLPLGMWTSGTDSEETQRFNHFVIGQELSVENLEDERDAVPLDGSKHLYITAAGDLRGVLKDAVESIEAGNRRRDSKREIKLSGIVSIDDSGDDIPEQIAVGGTVVSKALASEFGYRSQPPVQVLLGVESESPPDPFAAGELEIEEGWSGTDVTPGDMPAIEVGTIDLLKKLESLVGRHVELVVKEVASLPPFRIVINPDLPSHAWCVPNLGWSPRPRPDKELDGEMLMDLARKNAGSIEVSFHSAKAVHRAIKRYSKLADASPLVLPEMEITTALRHPENCLTFSTPQEAQIAKAAVAAKRANKVLIVLGTDDASGVLGMTESVARAIRTATGS